MRWAQCVGVSSQVEPARLRDGMLRTFYFGCKDPRRVAIVPTTFIICKAGWGLANELARAVGPGTGADRALSAGSYSPARTARTEEQQHRSHRSACTVPVFPTAVHARGIDFKHGGSTRSVWVSRLHRECTLTQSLWQARGSCVRVELEVEQDAIYVVDGTRRKDQN